VNPKSPFLVNVSMTTCLTCADHCSFGKRSWREWKASTTAFLADLDILLVRESTGCLSYVEN
jgi:UTP:GlnB (protein PII) uridylyltransferase